MGAAAAAAGENGREQRARRRRRGKRERERGWPNFVKRRRGGGCGGGSRSFALGKILESFPPLSPAERKEGGKRKEL